MDAANLISRIDRLATKMVLKEPFVAAVFFKLERVIVPTGTASVDGKTVQFGLDFCSSLSDDELLFVMIHEALHVCFMHMWRRNERDPAVWNVANDAIINRIIFDSVPGLTMPQGGVLIDWVTKDMSSEEVYERLLQESEQGASGYGHGGWDKTGDLQDAPSAAEASEMATVVSIAARMAKACGVHSLAAERVLGHELKARVDWAEVLRHILTSVSRDDYSYRRFNKRTFQQGIYLPSLYSSSIGGVVIGVDTSGSISDTELEQIAAEVTAIAEDCQPDWIEVVYCDSRIKGIERFERGEPIRLHPFGGGGTAFGPVFDHVRDMAEPVAAVVYLTDLEGSFSDCKDPGVPVIWAVVGGGRDRAVPFGTVTMV